MPTPQDLMPQIVARLGRDANEDNLVLWVCEETGLDLSAAQTLINDAKVYHAGKIRRRRAPVRLALGGLILIAGIILTIYPLYTLVMQARQLQLTVGQALTLGLGQFLDPGFTTALTLGVAMMVGSGLALGEELAHVSEKET